LKDFDKICLDTEGMYRVTYRKGEVGKQKKIAVKNVEVFSLTPGAQKENLVSLK